MVCKGGRQVQDIEQAAGVPCDVLEFPQTGDRADSKDRPARAAAVS